MPQKHVLNVGGNSKTAPLPTHYTGWRHVMLDIDPATQPDVLCDARALVSQPAETYDAIYNSHNLEHFYKHDIPKVVRGFRHVLKTDGFAEIWVPDIANLMRHMVENNLETESVLYEASTGPITANDIIYGYGIEIERSGQDFFAHKFGFTPKVLLQVIAENGFRHGMLLPSRGNRFEVGALAFKQRPTAEQRALLGLPG